MSAGPILRRALIGGAVLALAVAMVGGALGYLLAQGPGLVGALVGAAASAVYLGVTGGSMLLAGRVTRGDTTSPVYFGIVLGVWVLKLLLFIVLALLAQGVRWMNPFAFVGAALVAVLGSLVIDVVVYQTSRVPYVDVPLPGERRGSGSARNT